MELIRLAKIEVNILLVELKDAIVSSHRDDIMRKLETLYKLIDLYEEQ